MKLQHLAWAACVLGLAAAPACAAAVEVKFTDAERYADAGNTRWDERANLEVLARHFKAMGGRYLPKDQTLSIEVLDVDLAGESWPSRRGYNIRVVRGMADWPRITLRYTLQGPGGEMLRQGEERISDPGYTGRSVTFGDSDALRYEKRMLDEWFRKNFTRNQAQAGG